MTAGTGRNEGRGERIIRCPICNGDSVYAASNPSRPFCSVRCRDVDLGAWAFGSYRMPAKPDIGNDTPE